MKLNKKQKTVLVRFVRVMVHGAVAACAALLASPDVLDLLGAEWTPITMVLGTAFLNSLSKSLRYGNDEGEELGDSELSMEN